MPIILLGFHPLGFICSGIFVMQMEQLSTNEDLIVTVRSVIYCFRNTYSNTCALNTADNNSAAMYSYTHSAHYEKKISIPKHDRPLRCSAIK